MDELIRIFGIEPTEGLQIISGINLDSNRLEIGRAHV